MVSTKFIDYNNNSNDAINIIFVHQLYDIMNPRIKFKPLMTHQMFDDENIYGYHRLKVNIYIAAHSAYCFVKFHYDEVILSNEKFGLEPDNIIGLLSPWFPNNLMTDIEDFKDCVNRSEPDYIYGNCVDCFTNINEQGETTGFRVISCDTNVPAFKEFHKRFQSLIIMFIDAANFIDLDDPCWHILYLYEDVYINGKQSYCPVGFCSIYLFKSTTTIARISQFFIVPFLQKLGLGYRLLKATYYYLKATFCDLEEITVESPNQTFTRMRDNLDVSYFFNDSHFTKEKLFNGYSDSMLIRARLIYKLTNKQARRVYEILRCYWAQGNEKEYEAFILDVKKNRYNKILQKKSKLNSDNKLRVRNENISELLTEDPELLQAEFDEFIESIQVTLKYIQEHFGGSTRTS